MKKLILLFLLTTLNFGLIKAQNIFQSTTQKKQLQEENVQLKNELAKAQEDNKLLKQKAQAYINKLRMEISLLNDSIQILQNTINSMEKPTNETIKEGTYVNSVGQKLVIINLSDNSFEYSVDWGVNDEWGCLFHDDGVANFSSPDYDFIAYTGEVDWPSLKFFVNCFFVIFFQYCC